MLGQQCDNNVTGWHYPLKTLSDKVKDRKSGKPKRGNPNPKKRTKKGATEPSEPKGPKSIRRNLTDYDSRIMRLAGGNWEQAFNAQAVAEGSSQLSQPMTIRNK
jgi:hypothetical protein